MCVYAFVLLSYLLLYHLEIIFLLEIMNRMTLIIKCLNRFMEVLPSFLTLPTLFSIRSHRPPPPYFVFPVALRT